MLYLEGILTNDDPNIKKVTNAIILRESGASANENKVHRASTILLTTSHVLKFSPVSRLANDMDLSTRQYLHRFQQSKDPKAVASFDLEDWC